MSDIADGSLLPKQLAHVVWLGGGSGSGKSTLARRLAREHNMQLYDTDGVMLDHASRSTGKDCPLLKSFMQMSMDERWVNRSPEVMLDTFHWFKGEGFDFIVNDLLRLPRERPVIVEGFRLLPELVKPLIQSLSQALWLLPTPEFRLQAFTARGTLWDIAGETSRPQLALDNLLTRDALFTERLKNDIAALGLSSIVVDGQIGENEMLDLVFSQLNISQFNARPPL